MYKAERSRGRMVALIAGGVLVVAAAAAVAVSLLGGSSNGKGATSVSSTATAPGAPRAAHHGHKLAPKRTPKVSPAETSVAVLNATEAEGLARRTASALQQSGYSQATAVYGKPPGSSQVTVVEYASGHEAEAEGVARSISVSHVLPIEAAVTALASSANVVVIVGADKAAQSP